MIKTQPLVDLFQDKMFAWNLLQYQILIQTAEEPDGQDISNLLQLYMRGVEVMNTMLDPRESYFRSKVTDLMGKNTVRKTFKTKNEVLVEAEKKKAIEPEHNGSENKKQSKKILKKKSDALISANTLQQKKKQLQLRLAYAAQQINPQSLRKLLNKNVETQIKITSKVQNIIDSHQKRLNQRINRRKLKSSTYRSKQDEVQTMQEIEEDEGNGKNIKIPITYHSNSLKCIPQVIHERPIKNSQRRLSKSLETKQKVSHFQQNTSTSTKTINTPAQNRKLSMDLTSFIKI